MKELKDVSFGVNAVMLRDNHVTTSILPKNTSELQRNIAVGGDVEVEGAIYANTLEITSGPAEFHGAIFASGEIHIAVGGKGPIYFHKSVASAQSIVSSLTNGIVVFGGDINAPSIKLKNTFVCGSVYGNDITLENSVILGGVFAAKTLEVNSSIVGTFSTSEVRSSGENYLLYPTSFSVEAMTVLPGTKWWNISLADLGNIYAGEEQTPGTGKIAVDIDSDAQRTVLTDSDGTQTLLISYSVSSRVIASDVLDYDKLKNHFLLVGAAMGDQLLKSYKLPLSNGKSGPEISTWDVADMFFKIINGKISINEISGEIDFKELAEKFGTN